MSVFSQSAEVFKTEEPVDYDTNYLKNYHELMNARFYLSRKFTNLSIIADDGRFGTDEDESLNYEPNTTVNMGIGATYRGFTLNLAYGFSFLNREAGRGETRYLDLQTHKFARKYAIDIYAQFYGGMYMDNAGVFNALYQDQYLVRPDINISMIGAGYTRVFNDKRFSYAASLVQSEYQRKSAGSFLLGGKVILFGANADSSMVPTWVTDSDTTFNAFKGVTQMGGIQLGPGVGYAHTFVAWHHWFITLSLELNFMLGPTSYSTESGEDFGQFQLNGSSDFKLAMGYNSPKTYIGIMFVDNRTNLHSIDDSMQASYGVGNVRFNYVRRFELGPKWKKRLGKLPL